MYIELYILLFLLHNSNGFSNAIFCFSNLNCKFFFYFSSLFFIIDFCLSSYLSWLPRIQSLRSTYLRVNEIFIGIQWCLKIVHYLWLTWISLCLIDKFSPTCFQTILCTNMFLISPMCFLSKLNFQFHIYGFSLSVNLVGIIIIICAFSGKLSFQFHIYPRV